MLCDPEEWNLRHVMVAFARPQRWRSWLQLVLSVGAFVAGCASMYAAASISWALVLILALPTGVLVVRIFIIQHDCGHGSFFESRRANDVLGRLCSLVTLTPYDNWARQHRQHHADWNDLDRVDGDPYSTCLTVAAWRTLPAHRRLAYGFVRHPLIANLILPPLLFVLIYRLPLDTPKTWRRERWSVHLTNAALLLVFGGLSALAGWRIVALVHLSSVSVAAILGAWLFTVQHRFEGAVWRRRCRWNYVEAALAGASWLDLPAVLHWLTGNIGFHHVHHLAPRIPNYALAAAHRALQGMHPVPGMGLRAALRAPWLILWDENSGRLVGLRAAAAIARARPATKAASP